MRDICEFRNDNLIRKIVRVKFDSVVSQFDGNSSSLARHRWKLIMRTRGILLIVKIDMRSPPSRSYETAKMIVTEEFFSATWQADKHQRRRCCDMTRRSRQREPNFRWKFAPGKMQTGFLHWWKFGALRGTVIISGLIKNRLLFYRKCPSVEFGPRGSRANAMNNNKIYALGTTRGVKVSADSLQFNSPYTSYASMCVLYLGRET